jgi:hypothetical protein
MTAANVSEIKKEEKPNLIEIGYTGLDRSGGDVLEEFHKSLSGTSGIKVYREMRDNDSTIGASIYLIDSIIRQVDWRVERGTGPRAEEAAVFLESCLIDMSHTWEDFLSEVMSMMWFGWSYFEKIYKIRGGDSNDPTKRSRFNDGKIGWRKIPIRAQETLDQWLFDEDGGIKGMYQVAAPDFVRVFIPIEKSVLFRTSLAKNNPEGRSMLRNAYRSWFFLKRIQEIEAIGIERDLVGLPMLQLPEAYFDASATPAKKAALRQFTQLLQQLRRGEHEGLALPSELDRDGKPTGYKFSLVSTGGSRQIHTGNVIERYEKRIAMSLLTQFLFLGMDRVGSQSLSGDMTGIFTTAIGSLLTSIESTFNRFCVSELMKLNGFDAESWPAMKAGEIQREDMRPLAEMILKLVDAGTLTPDSAIEDFLRGELGLPERIEDEMSTEEDALLFGLSSGDAEEIVAFAATLNELSLAIERLARVGDIAMLNVIRRAYAAALGIEYSGDIQEISQVVASQSQVDVNG